MTAINDIQDVHSFETWLRETNQPSMACIALAARTALRVLPLVWNDYLSSALPLLRARLVGSVAGLAPSTELTERGQFSKLRKNFADSVYIDAVQAIDANAYDAADAAANAVYAGDYAAYAAAVAHAAAAYAATTAANSAGADAIWEVAWNTIWKAIRSDCQKLADGAELRLQPLFHGQKPDWFDHAFDQVRAAATSEWSFWLDWYDRALEGREQNWRLLLEIATQDNAFWQGSDAEINARIAEIVERHALAASYAARRVVADERTKLLRAEVVTTIEPGFFQVALGRLRDAVDEMRAVPGFSNQYTALEPELQRIEDFLERHLDKPLRIYELTERTGRLINLKIKDGQLPENDPILEDFKTEVDNSGHDILHGDREVAEVIRRRFMGRFDRLDQQEKEHFRAITPLIAPICEESLAEELSAEIAIVNDPEALPDDQNEAMWRWSGLILRIFRFVRERVHDYAAYVTLANAERGAIIGYLL